MNRTTDIIVLHTTKYGENAAVLHTLSREYGRRSFIVKGVGKKSMTTLFLPLSILEADIIESTRSNLFSARNLTARYPLLGIRNSHYKNPMTMFMSEVLFRVVREGCNEDGLYEWCEKSILLLDAMESDFSNFHLRFLLELAVALGFRPDVSDLMPFVGEHYPVIERLMTSSFGESMLIPLSGAVRNAVAEEILRYIEYHAEVSLNVKSLKVLRELFL